MGTLILVDTSTLHRGSPQRKVHAMLSQITIIRLIKLTKNFSKNLNNAKNN